MYCNCCWFAIENLQKKKLNLVIKLIHHHRHHIWIESRKKEEMDFFFGFTRWLWRWWWWWSSIENFFLSKWNGQMWKKWHTHTHKFPTTKTLVGLDFFFIISFLYRCFNTGHYIFIWKKNLDIWCKICNLHLFGSKKSYFRSDDDDDVKKTLPKSWGPFHHSTVWIQDFHIFFSTTKIHLLCTKKIKKTNWNNYCPKLLLDLNRVEKNKNFLFYPDR